MTKKINLSDYVIPDIDTYKIKAGMNINIYNSKDEIDEYFNDILNICSKQEKLLNSFKYILEKSFKTTKCNKRHMLWNKIIQNNISSKIIYEDWLKTFCIRSLSEKLIFFR